jgi:serine/threonine-protein kinase
MAIMQGDGNFVVYASPSQLDRDGAVWATETANHPGAELVVDEQGGFGRVAIVATDGTVLWDETAQPAPERVPVPDVRQLTEHEARVRLEEAGFEVTTTERSSDSAPAGLVIDTEPSPGTELRPGSIVELIVAAPVPVTVPDVRGMFVDQAEATLAAAGLVAEARLERTSGAPAGTVTEQDPFAGTEVAEGSIVTIFVSEGPIIG